jgi:hypothetical protein
MPLQMHTGTFLTSKEAAARIGIAYGTFTNRRTSHGDRFLRGHHELIAGRVLFSLEDVERHMLDRTR